MKYVFFCFVDVEVVGICAVVVDVVHRAVDVDFLNTEVSNPWTTQPGAQGIHLAYLFVTQNHLID